MTFSQPVSIEQYHLCHFQIKIVNQSPYKVLRLPTIMLDHVTYVRVPA